jgi:hypothetical protein
MSIQIEFELSREDWDEAVRLYARKREPRHNPMRMLTYVGCAATALGFLLLVRRPDGGGWVAPVALIVSGVFVPLRLNAIVHAQRDDAWAARERLIQPAIWVIDDAALHTTSAHWQATLKWSAFNRWLEGPTVFLLFSSAEDFRVFPKRAFADPDEIAAFRRLLDSHVVPDSTRGFPVTHTPAGST